MESRGGIKLPPWSNDPPSKLAIKFWKRRLAEGRDERKNQEGAEAGGKQKREREVSGRCGRRSGKRWAGMRARQCKRDGPARMSWRVCVSLSFSLSLSGASSRHRRHRPSLTHTLAAAHHKMAVAGLKRGKPRPKSGHYFLPRTPLAAAGEYSFTYCTRILVRPNPSSLACMIIVIVFFELKVHLVVG